MIASFKVYPGRGNGMSRKTNLYFKVLVFDNLKEMYEACRKVSDGYRGSNFLAIVLGQEIHRFRRKPGGKRRRWTKSPFLGYALFCKEYLGTEIVSHESFHMAMRFCDRERPMVVDSSSSSTHKEERLAYATGSCARQLVNHFYKNDLYKV